MEIYKDLSNPASQEFEKLLNSQLSKVQIEEGKIIRLIEAFDSSLANNSLWGDSKKLIPDEDFSLKNFS